MGSLGLSLCFVSITLILNGINRKDNINAKTTAFLNVFTGVLLFIINTVALTRAAEVVDYLNISSGMLFALTYLFVAANNLFGLDLRAFGWFSGWATVYAVIQAVMSFDAGDMRFTLLWAAWAVLWFSGFAEITLRWKISKIAPWIVIAEGLFATGLPGIIMILGLW